MPEPTDPTQRPQNNFQIECEFKRTLHIGIERDAIQPLIVKVTVKDGESTLQFNIFEHHAVGLRDALIEILGEG